MTLRGRHRHTGLHGSGTIDKQRLIALLMIGTGLARVALWASLCVAYLLHVAFVRNLYASVSFVALLSVVALLLTDWSQVAASYAALVGGDTHHDAEETRKAIGFDMDQVQRELSMLAAAKPGEAADALQRTILKRLGGK